mmetsp:Transcript_67269/g.161236  ORF Transcript_67269/g.161236 Transcript_67269/m.161236 type:complete len:835 (-) Transcript_67269:41-2545(-)
MSASTRAGHVPAPAQRGPSLPDVLDLYMGFREESHAQPDLSAMLRNAGQWQFIFSRAAQDPDGPIVPAQALADGRLRLSLAQLQELWQQAPATQRSPASLPAPLSAAGGQGGPHPQPPLQQQPLEQRLQREPDVVLAEVAAGLHMAALSGVTGAPRPVASPQGAPAVSGAQADDQKERPRIALEVEAPELEVPIESLRSEFIGRYVGLRGNVVRCSSISPLVYELAFSCSRCGTCFSESAPDGRFKYPSQCPRKCRFARFALTKERCKGIDWQRLRVQEDLAEMGVQDGPARRVPKTVDCDVRCGLVGSCAAGDSVVVYGIVRHMPSSGALSRGGESRDAKATSLFMLFLDVRAVINNRRESSTGSAGGPRDFTPLQLAFIRDVYHQPERLPLLVASFCPQIYGQRLVKAALLLALFGGLPIFDGSTEKRLRRRGDVHVLLLGDPGLGKSELLRALAQLSARGVYVAGNSSSVAGLTAAVVREGGDFALEAGALVLADNGLCCIDEFDKMGADQQALLEAMEQQTVSIAKAGIVCTLPARASVVTAANPAKGRWDTGLTFAQNLKGVMTEALLSRFDVTFLMRDEEGTAEDAAVCQHIVKRRMLGTAAHDREGASYAAGSSGDWANSGEADVDRHRAGGSLGERCAAFVCKEGGLPRELLMTYIRYARCFSQPELSPGAKRKLKEYYLKRKAAAEAFVAGSGHLPITPRLLESLIRLSQARARAELRRVVLCSDVDDVLDIVKAGSEDFEDRFALVPHRKGKNRTNQLVDRLRDRLELLVRRSGRREVRASELRSFAGTGISDVEFEKAIFRLNSEQNVLLVAGAGMYRYVGGG